VKTCDADSASRLLAAVLLRDVERIAQRSVARMQERVASYARVPRDELMPIVLANTRRLLEAIRDPALDRGRERADEPPSDQALAAQGITSEDMSHGWRISLEVVREAAYAAAEELQIGNDALLEFVEASLQWRELGPGAAASAHHGAGLEAAREEFRRLAEEQAALRRVATLVARGAPSERLFAVVAEQVAGVMGVPAVRIASFQDDGTATDRATFSDPHRSELFPAERRWSLEGASVLSRVRAGGLPVRLDDHSGLQDEIAHDARGVGSTAVGIPIAVAGRMWGAMIVFSADDEPLPVDTEARLTAFTELLSMAISNANARAEAERLAQEQAALRRVATMVAREAAPEEVFAQVAEEVGVLLDADASLIQRYESDGAAISVGSWGNASRVGSRWTLDGESSTAVVYRTHRSVRFEHYEHAAGEIAAESRRLGLRSAVASPIVVNGREWGALVAATARPEPLPRDAESRIAQFTELVATAISNVQARSDAERLAAEQAALRRVATMVAFERPPEEIFAAVAEEIGLLLGVEAAIVRRYEPDGYATTVGTWGVLSDVFPVGSRGRADGDSLTALVYRTGRPARVGDYVKAKGSMAAQARTAGVRSAVGSPIVVNGHLWGALGAGTSRSDPMPADAESRIAEFSELIATAISNVQARSDLAASRARIVAAADEERRRVVRELHDGAQQHLVHTVMTVKLARRALERGQADAAALVDQALEHAQTGTEELRELAHGILPAVLTDGGLGAGLRALASRMSIPVEVDVSVGRLPRTVEATAYFIVAEALTNVAKHSQAQHAAVRLRVEGDTLRVEVCDDGVGGVRAEGVALIGLRDRVAALDGSLRVDSPADGGTVIKASLPVRRPGEPASGRRDGQV
jgi:signal transduction histidine kinase